MRPQRARALRRTPAPPRTKPCVLLGSLSSVGIIARGPSEGTSRSWQAPRFTILNLLHAVLQLPLAFTSIYLILTDNLKPILQIRKQSRDRAFWLTQGHRSIYPPPWVRLTTSPSFPQPCGAFPENVMMPDVLFIYITASELSRTVPSSVSMPCPCPQ